MNKGPSSRAFSFHVRLADAILAAPPGGVKVSAVTTRGSLSFCFPLSRLPASIPNPLPPSQRSASLKSPLRHVSRRSEAPGVPLRPFPWSLGSSLCHVAQSEPSLGRITRLSMGGQMTIIRLHSLGPYLKRKERSPGDLR